MAAEKVIRPQLHPDRVVVAVPRWMIESTRDDDGDANYPAALMLAQVTFWTHPDGRTGLSRADHRHGAHHWLTRADDQWEAELGMSRKAARKARLRLVALGFIEVATLVDNGVRCTHIRRLYPDGAAVAEPSTIVPESEHARPRPSSGSGTEHVPDQALSHAGASPSSLETKEETSEKAKKAPLAERDPQLARAYDIVKRYWDYCHANDIPRPTLKNDDGNPYNALAKIIRRLLDDGWQQGEIKTALLSTRAFTIDAISYTLREARQRATTDGPNPHLVRY